MESVRELFLIESGVLVLSVWRIVQSFTICA
jgi:hypothetical protein